MSKKANLKELVDLNELQAIQDGFAKTVDTSSVIFSPEGEPLTQFSNPTGFCSLIQSTKEGKQRCFLSFMAMCQVSVESKVPKIRYCFAHGGHFVAPIIIDGEHKGTMFAGQFIPQKFSTERLKKLEKTALEIHVDPQLLIEEAKKMRVVEEDVVMNYSSLLFQIVEVITRLGAQADELNLAKDALQMAHNGLEIRVQERTAELARANEELKQEIDERKRAEGAQQESEIRYRSIFNSATDSFLIFDPDGNIVEANLQACKMYGYPYEELIKLSGKNIVHPDYSHLFEQFKKDVQTNGEFHAESVDVHKDGSTFDVEVRGTAFDYKGKKHLLAVVRDITELKKKTEALKRFNKLAVDREMVMMELKQEVNRLSVRLDEKPPYDLSFVDVTLSRKIQK